MTASSIPLVHREQEQTPLERLKEVRRRIDNTRLNVKDILPSTGQSLRLTLADLDYAIAQIEQEAR